MEIKKTITTIFMVPTLGIPRGELTNNGFINGYIKDARRDVQYEGVIYLLLRPKNLDKFREFLDSEYERTKNVIDDYDYEDGLIVIVYKLDPNFKPDFDLVKKGKYSKTSLDFQATFPTVVKIVKNGLHLDEVSLQYRIFNRSQDLISYWEKEFGMVFDHDQEVWRGFREEDEILTLDKMKENV